LEFKLKLGSLKLIPSTGGVFEVSVNGRSIFSKKATGQFPEPDAVLKELKKYLAS
jgi:selenoprotein W-related protein